MTAVERLLATARGEVGYLEKASNQQLDNPAANAGCGNWTKYARDLDGMGTIYNGKKNGYDWCDVFVDWCFITTFGQDLGMKLLCQAYGGLGAGTRYSANYYKAKGRYYQTSPQPGDQIFFGDGKTMWHTGIVTKVANNQVYTIEGNTTGASGVVANGGGVAEKSYPLTYRYIDGYGRPDWSLMQKEEDKMDLNGFKKLWQEMRRELQDNDSSTYSEAARKWAVESGLFQGDGNANYMWEDLMTREQLATVLYRFAQQMGQGNKTVPVN